MTHPINADLECWRPPQSPFQILYSRLVLEQIRLAVVDAYFLVPRGGLEIGGVLLGKHRDRQIEVMDHEPMDCEHAFGPSFSLSPRDEERLKDVLAKVRARPGGLDPVGWYHSHTRSEICLTEPDLDIHERYFPETWQIALVLRPSASQPARAGFFFRELGGSIRASASYHEFKLEPLRGGPTLLKPEADTRALPPPQPQPAPLSALTHTRPPLKLTPPPIPKPPRERPAPLAPASTASTLAGPPRERPARLPDRSQPAPEREFALTENPRPLPQLTPTLVARPAAAPTLDPRPQPARPVTPIDDPAPLPKPLAAAAVDPKPSPQPSSVPTPVRRVDRTQLIELPRFLRNEPPPRAQWTGIPIVTVGMICLAIALATFAFVARDALWASIAGLAGRTSPAAPAAPPRIGPAMSITAVDNLGQLQIRWDTASPAVRAARSSALSIVDGGPPQRVPLDGPHLETGTFTYKRRGPRVDARLSILTSEGNSVEAATTFLGPPAPPEAEPVPAGAAALAKQNAQLRRLLDEQIGRNKTLQAQLDRFRKQRSAGHPEYGLVPRASRPGSSREAPADRP